MEIYVISRKEGELCLSLNFNMEKINCLKSNALFFLVDLAPSLHFFFQKYYYITCVLNCISKVFLCTSVRSQGTLSHTLEGVKNL